MDFSTITIAGGAIVSWRRFEALSLDPYKAAQFAPLCHRLRALLADTKGGEVTFSIPHRPDRLWMSVATEVPAAGFREAGFNDVPLIFSVGLSSQGTSEARQRWLRFGVLTGIEDDKRILDCLLNDSLSLSSEEQRSRLIVNSRERLTRTGVGSISTRNAHGVILAPFRVPNEGDFFSAIDIFTEMAEHIAMSFIIREVTQVAGTEINFIELAEIEAWEAERKQLFSS